jgi:hypothetical protein
MMGKHEFEFANVIFVGYHLKPEHQSQVSNKQTRREIVGNNMLG